MANEDIKKRANTHTQSIKVLFYIHIYTQLYIYACLKTNGRMGSIMREMFNGGENFAYVFITHKKKRKR